MHAGKVRYTTVQFDRSVLPHRAIQSYMTRTDQIIQSIQKRIAARNLAAGEKLPSIRRMAANMQVSPSTVVDAYDRLAAEGIIRSRPGSGFYVTSATAPLQLAQSIPKPERDIDPFWVSRQSLDADPDALKPGCGWLPADWMPNDLLRKGLRRLARAEDVVLSDYAGTRGALKLRQFLSRTLAAEDLTVAPDQILLTGSGTQAIDLICRFLLQPGDTVLVDDPCYFNFQALLKAHQVTIVGVPFTPKGPDIDAFAKAASTLRPRLYITNSGLHNPTGATLSPRVAHQILGIASSHDMVIVEDDIFAAYEPDLSPRYAAMDGLNHVIRIGSFSKTLSASVRCGYIAARPDWMEALVDLQVATHFGGASSVATEILWTALSDGSYRKHIDALHVRLSRARRDTAQQLANLGIQPWVLPRGGFYLWCALPKGIKATQMARNAMAKNVVLAPGNVFSPSRSMPNFMRFNVSQMAGPKIYDVLESAMNHGMQ